jgi:flagellar basal body rod protein FlgF
LITGATVAGNGGNIQLQVEETLTLRKNSTISALANNNADGGNINYQFFSN